MQNNFQSWSCCGPDPISGSFAICFIKTPVWPYRNRIFFITAIWIQCCCIKYSLFNWHHWEVLPSLAPQYFVFYMKVLQATLSLSAGGLSPQLGSAQFVSPQFCRWEWRIYHSALTNIWVPPPVERPLYSPLLGFGEVLAGSNSSTTLMTVNGVPHQKLNLTWKMSLDDPAARGHPCLESTQSNTTPPICLELGILLGCVKCLDSLEFRPFNFKVQVHLAGDGSHWVTHVYSSAVCSISCFLACL